MTRVRVESVSYRYHRTSERALDAVDLTVDGGELLCLVGPSGCGKTTLLKILSGLLLPEVGCLYYDDDEVTRVAPERRRAVMVFQSHLLFPFMNVLENVAFGLRMQGMEKKERERRAHEMLERVHLPGFSERDAHSLSAGQRQRVALARALVTNPRLLLLDEPLSNLDPHLREEMRQAILELQRDTRVTTVCVTHDQEEAVLLGDRIAMLRDGRLLQVGSAEEFYERPASASVARFFGNHNQIEGTLEGSDVGSLHGTFRVMPAAAPAPWPVSGPVCMHIRPESIEIQAECNGDGSRSNLLCGQVTHRVFMGTHVRYTVDVGGRPWQVVSPPAQRGFGEGERVMLHLPPERIWLTRD
jgi:ABC-type Fe3+/spermidine/putrescine transport system ATPase subunit